MGGDAACQGWRVICTGDRDRQGAHGLGTFIIERGIGDFSGCRFTGFQMVKGCSRIKGISPIGADGEGAAIGAGDAGADIGCGPIDGGDGKGAPIGIEIIRQHPACGIDTQGSIFPGCGAVIGDFRRRKAGKNRSNIRRIAA